MYKKIRRHQLNDDVPQILNGSGSALPVLPSENYTDGTVFFLTTENSYYRSNGSVWTRVTTPYPSTSDVGTLPTINNGVLSNTDLRLTLQNPVISLSATSNLDLVISAGSAVSNGRDLILRGGNGSSPGEVIIGDINTSLVDVRPSISLSSQNSVVAPNTFSSILSSINTTLNNRGEISLSSSDCSSIANPNQDLIEYFNITIDNSNNRVSFTSAQANSTVFHNRCTVTLVGMTGGNSNIVNFSSRVTEISFDDPNNLITLTLAEIIPDRTQAASLRVFLSHGIKGNNIFQSSTFTQASGSRTSYINTTTVMGSPLASVIVGANNTIFAEQSFVLGENNFTAGHKQIIFGSNNRTGGNEFASSLIVGFNNTSGRFLSATIVLPNTIAFEGNHLEYITGNSLDTDNLRLYNLSGGTNNRINVVPFIRFSASSATYDSINDVTIITVNANDLLAVDDRTSGRCVINNRGTAQLCVGQSNLNDVSFSSIIGRNNILTGGGLGQLSICIGDDNSLSFSPRVFCIGRLNLFINNTDSFAFGLGNDIVSSSNTSRSFSLGLDNILVNTNPSYTYGLNNKILGGTLNFLFGFENTCGSDRTPIEYSYVYDETNPNTISSSIILILDEDATGIFSPGLQVFLYDNKIDGEFNSRQTFTRSVVSSTFDGADTVIQLNSSLLSVDPERVISGRITLLNPLAGNTIIGYQCRSNANDTYLFGKECVALSSANFSSAFGYKSQTYIQSQFSYSGGLLNGQNAQLSILCLQSLASADAGTALLRSGESTAQVLIPSGRQWTFTCLIQGSVVGSILATDKFSAEIKGLAYNNGSSSVLVNSLFTTIQGPVGWSATVVVSGNELQISGTKPITSGTVKWHATVFINDLVYT